MDGCRGNLVAADVLKLGVDTTAEATVKSQQMRLGEEAERVASGVVMDGLGVLVGEEVELVVNGWTWAGEQLKDWLTWE